MGSEPTKTTFVAAADGAVVPYTPPAPPARTLSREERTDAYRDGLRATAGFLRELGFQSHYECEHSYTMSYRGVLLDFRVQRPTQVAYISSRQFPGGKRGKHGGTIYKLSDEVKSEFALMLTVGSKATAPPIFVELSENLPDPAKLIRDSILGLLASLDLQGDRLGRSVRDKALPCDPKELPEWL